MTEKELTEKLHEIARAGAIAAVRHLAPELQPIVDDFNAGKANLAEVRERAAAVFAASEARLDFVMKTQRRMAQSLGQLAAQTPGQVRRYPAWRLVRGGTRREPRNDWEARWLAAGNASGWHGNPLQCSCLENPRGRRVWWATVYGVAQSRTRLK